LNVKSRVLLVLLVPLIGLAAVRIVERLRVPVVKTVETPMSVETIRAMEQILSTQAWHRFTSLDKAAMYGAARLELCSHYYECSATIVIDSRGRYAVSPLHTDYASDHVQVIRSGPSDWEVAADLHSHPCLPHHATAVFSPEDMSYAITKRTTAYMVDMCTGNVHKFVPGVTKQDEELIDDDVWLSGGKIIGQVAAFKDAPLANEGI
jgi:hypothetical protein